MINICENKHNVLQLNHQSLAIYPVSYLSGLSETSSEEIEIIYSDDTASICSETKLFELVS